MMREMQDNGPHTSFPASRKEPAAEVLGCWDELSADALPRPSGCSMVVVSCAGFTRAAGVSAPNMRPLPRPLPLACTWFCSAKSVPIRLYQGTFSRWLARSR